MKILEQIAGAVSLVDSFLLFCAALSFALSRRISSSPRRPVFNFVTTVPTWLNEKAASTGVVSAVIVATAAGLLNSIMVGSAIAGSVAVGAATNMTGACKIGAGV